MQELEITDLSVGDWASIRSWLSYVPRKCSVLEVKCGLEVGEEMSR